MEKILIVILEVCDFKSCEVHEIKSNNKNIYIEEIHIGVLLLDMNMILTKSQRI